MPIQYKKMVAIMEEQVSVQEAEELLSWLQEDTNRKVNLKKCGHLHAAVLQTLMFLKPKITVRPENQELNKWLNAAQLS